MYADFFGFKELPFNNTPDPRFFFATPDHEEGLASLIYAVTERKGFVLLTGEVGTGKTLVTRMMLRHFGTDLAFANINHSVQSPVELMQSICTEFELDHRPDASSTQLVRTLHDFLLAQFAQNMPVVLVLDEAQNLPVQAFEQLRMIGNLEADDAKLLQIAIVGQPELQRMFLSPKLRQLRQRIFRSYHLPALTHDATARYIQHRLSIVCDSSQSVFDEGAVARIFQVSQGLPRLINTVCDNALLSAYSVERRELDAAFVESVVSQMMILGEPMPEKGNIPKASASQPLFEARPPQTTVSDHDPQPDRTTSAPVPAVERPERPRQVVTAPTRPPTAPPERPCLESVETVTRGTTQEGELFARVERFVHDQLDALRREVAGRGSETAARQASIEKRFVAATKDLTEARALFAQLDTIVQTVTATTARAEATARTIAQRDTQLRQVTSSVKSLITDLGSMLGRAREATAEVVQAQRGAMSARDRLLVGMKGAHELADELTQLSNRITSAAGKVTVARFQNAAACVEPLSASETTKHHEIPRPAAAAVSHPGSDPTETMLSDARESLCNLRSLATANRTNRDVTGRSDDIQVNSATPLANQVEDLLEMIAVGNTADSERSPG